MGSRLANVRLDHERLRKARRLRERGLTLSDLVRDAIDARYEALVRSETPRDLGAVVTRILEEHPDPPNLAGRSYDVHDRRQAQQAIRRRLQRTRG